MRFAACCTFALANFLTFEARGQVDGQVEPVALSWEAPAECPSRESVVATVRRLVRAMPEKPLPAQVRVTRAGDRWTAAIETPNGRRTLDAESCSVLAETVSVIIAIAVDPDAINQVGENPAFDEQHDAAAALPDAQRPDASRREVPTVSAAPARDARGEIPSRDGTAEIWTIGLSLRALFELGILPGPAFGGTLAARAERGIWGVELGASALLPQEGEFNDDSRFGGTLWWFAGHALGCVSPRSALSWDACLGVEVGRLSGTGFGVDVPRTGRALWFGPLTSAGARFPLGSSFSFEGRLGLALPLPRPPAFGLDGFGEVHRPATVSGRAELGIRWN
jgi:hypothetical protein